MKFEEIDAILLPWVDRNQLGLQTIYRDEEVRSICIVDDQGDSYQLWVESGVPIRVGYALDSAAEGHISQSECQQFRGSTNCSTSSLMSTLRIGFDSDLWMD